MTLEEFILKYNGKPIDYDGFYGNQCIDLYRQYVKEVLELPQSPSVTGAKDIWATYLKKHYTRHPRASDSIPQPGDIVIWGAGLGNTYGHIAVCVNANKNNFISFDQNFPEDSLCHLQKHNYNHVLGWIRKRVIIEDMNCEEEIRKLNTEIGRVTRERDELRSQLTEETQQKIDKDEELQRCLDRPTAKKLVERIQEILEDYA